MLASRDAAEIIPSRRWESIGSQDLSIVVSGLMIRQTDGLMD